MKHSAKFPGFCVRQPTQHMQLALCWHAVNWLQQLILVHATHCVSAGAGSHGPIMPLVDDALEALDALDALDELDPPLKHSVLHDCCAHMP